MNRDNLFLRGKARNEIIHYVSVHCPVAMETIGVEMVLVGMDISSINIILLSSDSMRHAYRRHAYFALNLLGMEILCYEKNLHAYRLHPFRFDVQ